MPDCVRHTLTNRVWPWHSHRSTTKDL